MSSAAIPSGADSNRFAPHGYWDIGIGRCPLDLRAVAQVKIHGVRDLDCSGVRIELTARTISDWNHLRRQTRPVMQWIAARRTARLLFLNGLINGAAQLQVDAIDLCRRTRSNIYAHAGRFGDRIDRRSTPNYADIESRLRRRRNSRLRKKLDGPSKRHNRIGRTEVAPRMSAGAAHNHFKAAAAKSFRNDGVSASPIKHEARNDRILPFRFRKNVTHAAQITFALFAHVAYKQQRIFMRQVEIFNGRGHSK